MVPSVSANDSNFAFIDIQPMKIEEKPKNTLISRLMAIKLMCKLRKTKATTTIINNDHGVVPLTTSTSTKQAREIISEDATDAGTADEHDHPNFMDSKTMVELEPTSDELACIAAHRANEYIDECLSTELSSVVDRQMWESIPQFTKMDLTVGRHLGKGTFSDVFQVVALVSEEEEEPPTRESLDLDCTELDKLIKRMFHSKEADLDKMGMDPSSTEKNKQPIRDMENESSEEISQPQSVEDRIHVRAPRRRTMEYNARPAVVEGAFRHRTSRTLAMKCLRPQTRSNMHQFMIGVEDLVNETAMLASLDHPNIIKLHGRAKGCDTNSFRLSDGFFILLDRLLGTLEDSIVKWKRAPSVNEKSTSTSPWTSQIQTACSIADAMSYLHSKNIVFRDLKPANVGFNSTGVLKLFDFGFAKKVVDPPNKSSPSRCRSDGELSYLLYERCGTVRYMAPEVGLELGHSLPADVYSFGILLWEICSLKKPYARIQSTSDFYRMVFRKGARPKLSKEWSTNLKVIMRSCWLPTANDRPTMHEVKNKIHAHAREVAGSGNGGGSGNNNNNNVRRSSLFRKF